MTLPTITSANLVFDFDPATAGFTDGQSVSSWAASNNGSITATQGTGSRQPTYRASAGRRNKPCVDFDGNDILLVTPVAFKHLFVVAEGDYPTEIPAAYAVLYCAGNGGDFAQYCMVFPNASGSPPNTWQTPTGTVVRKQNGDLVEGGSYWNSWIRPSQINIYDISKTIDWPTASTHTLGNMTADLARSWDGRIFRVVSYDAILSAGDRQSVIDYFREQYQTPRIFFAGDSLTLGTGATNQSTAYPKVARAAVSRSYSYWVDATSGIAISTMDTNAATTIDTQNPHTIVIWGGANNFAVSSHSAATAKGQLDTYLSARKAANPSVRILVCTLYEDNRAVTGDAANYRSQAPLYNDLITADVTYTNGSKADGLVRLDEITELADATNTTYFSDGLHLKDAGYALVGAAVAAKINERDSARKFLGSGFFGPGRGFN